MTGCNLCQNTGEHGECVCGMHSFELGTVLAAARLAREGSMTFEALLDEILASEGRVFRRMRQDETAQRGRAPLGRVPS